MESITFLALYFSRPNTITLGYLAVQVGHARTGVALADRFAATALWNAMGLAFIGAQTDPTR